MYSIFTSAKLDEPVQWSHHTYAIILNTQWSSTIFILVLFSQPVFYLMQNLTLFSFCRFTASSFRRASMLPLAMSGSRLLTIFSAFATSCLTVLHKNKPQQSIYNNTLWGSNVHICYLEVSTVSTVLSRNRFLAAFPS